MNNEYSLIPVDFDPSIDGVLEKAAFAIESQQEIWSSCIIGGDDSNCSFNLSTSLHLTGPFNRRAMEMALHDLINRHESLRTSISTDGRYLCIYKNSLPDIFFEDLSLKESSDQQNYLSDFSKKNAKTPFDLQKGPLFRTALFKTSEQEYTLMLTVHHMICDGWSLGVILEDISKLYSAYAKGETPSLEKAITFSQYAIETHKFSKSNLYKKTEDYWVKQYSHSVPRLDLPTDFPRPLHRTYKSRRDDIILGPELIAAIKNTGGKAGSSLVSTIMAAFEIYLHKVTGQQDIVLGLPSAGQSATGNYSVVGHCVNLLPLRSQPKGDLTFIEYLKLRKTKLMDDYEHQQFTFSSLLKKLNIARDSSRIPLVPVVFNIDIGKDRKVNFHELSYKLVSNPREYENFEIFIDATGTQSSITLEWSYNTQLFLPETIKRMMGEFETLIEQIVRDPNIQIKALSIVNKNLSSQIAKWNDTTVHYPKDKNFTGLIDAIAIQYPVKTAITFNNKQLTYKELVELSNRMANYLIQNGIQKGDIIGLAITRSTELIISLLAIIKSGAAYVPIDPEYPKDRIEFMLADSGAKILITNTAYIAQFESAAKELIIESIWPELSSYSDQLPDISLRGKDLAYVLYTSGSTGQPKGVLIKHECLINFLLSMQKVPGMASEDVLLALTTISFDIAGLELYLPLISGAEIVLADTSATKDARLLLELIEENNVSIVQATPSTWRMLLYAGLSKKHKLKALCGGEAFPIDLAEKLLDICDSVWNMYGPTETTIWSTVKKLTADSNIITIGRPIDNTQILILDEYQNLVPIGSSGEIYIGGEGLAMGYMNRPELTSEKFIPNHFDSQGMTKIYRTGDLGKYLGNGEVQCLGRIDHQLKIRGYRIEAGEIEHHLVKLDGIKEAVVIIREDNISDQRLVAYVVMDKNNISADQEQIPDNEHAIEIISIPEREVQVWKSSLKESLPDYMVPGEYVALEKLPMTNNGKIDRKLLPKPNNQSNQLNESTFIAPRTKTEKLIEKIWSELLNIKNISINSNFFELGGHSLIAIKVILNLERELGIRLSIPALFENSTIEKLAKVIARDDPSDQNQTKTENDGHTIMPLVNNDQITVPLTEPQKEIWLACELGGADASGAYNLSISQHFHGNVDYTAMRKAIQELVNRHEPLRATFNNEGTEMLIKSKETADWHFKDISLLLPEDQEAFLADFSLEKSKIIFDLALGPLFKVSFLKLSNEHHYFTLTAHHIIFDGWSYDAAMQELSILYSAYATGEMPKLAPAPLFSEYTLAKQTYYKSNEYNEIEKYWINQFQGELPTLELPVDFPRPKTRTFSSNRVIYKINSQLAGNLKKIGVKANCSLAITLRAALEILLYRLTGQKDIITGLPVAGQVTEGKENLIGHCVNMLPLRSKIESNLSFSEYLNKRKFEILEAYGYTNLTFGSLLKNINITRDRSRAPLISVFMNTSLRTGDGPSFYGLAHEFGRSDKSFENFEIALEVVEYEDGMTIRWDCNKALFKPETIYLFHQRFEYLLAQITSNPNLLIDELLVIPGELPKNRNETPKMTVQPSKQHDSRNFMAPRTEAEHLIASIWSSILNLDKVNIYSDFFELGGHSLIAVKVMIAIEKDTGKRLPLSALFENSTIEKLAQLIETEEDKIKWDSLVPVKPSGTKMPIYMVHGAGLNVLTFSSLGKYMDDDQPVYAIQALGLNGQSEFYYTLEEIAAKYIEEVLQNNPNGPYAVAGYSLGGIIAFEMVKQLKAMGREIAMLGILDTNALGHEPQEKSISKVFKKFIRQFKKLAFFSGQFVKRPKDTIEYQSKALTSKVKGLFIKHQPRIDDELFAYDDETARSYEIAYNSYVMNPIDIKLDLFKVKDRIYYLDEPVYHGWKKYALQGVDVHKVPGDHKTFLFPPNDKEFAETLQKVLNSKIQRDYL